jgi:ABC-type transport system involved in cytochrome c biogenesis permease subunit
MTLLLLSLAILLYLCATAASVAAFLRPERVRTTETGFGLAFAGFMVHGAAIGAGCAELGGRHLLTVAGAVGLGGWIAAGVLLLVLRTFRTAAAGAFTLPLILLATLPGLRAGRAEAPEAAQGLAALPGVQVHVTAAVSALALLVLAAVVGLMYLLQRHQLKGKRLGPLLRRLPSLHALEQLNGRLVAAGFAAFTVALLAGALSARTAWCTTWEWDGQRIAALAAWLVIAVMAAARGAGNRGHRQAVFSLAGLALVLTCMVGVRQVGAGSKHAALGAAAVLACAGRS